MTTTEAPTRLPKVDVHAECATVAARSDAVAIRASNLGKVYHIYSRPQDRLKQALWRWKKTYFKEFWAVKNVNFDVRVGETVGILGRNGAGKSTLLQMISGILTPSTGSVGVTGRVVPLLELGSGFNPEFSGRENVYLYGSILGLSREQLNERFAAIERFADIGIFIDQPLKTYSSGMHARLAFSVAAHVDPKVLIVDEILAVGDAAFKSKCTRVFHRLRDEGCTILLVAHDPYLIKTFCSQALYLRKGEQIAFGAADIVADKYAKEIEAAQMADKVFDIKDPDPKHDLTGSAVYSITDVQVIGGDGKPTDTLKTGDNVRVRFTYKTLKPGPDRVTFVLSMYRHDNLYICGTTTLMEGLPPFEPGMSGTVECELRNLPVLAGTFHFRVAIDDDRAFGIHAERFTKPITILDAVQAVGLVHLPRRWTVQAEGVRGAD
jgi:ABC-type polysaccharide/polyol phosphate transport system ATPase subunit